MRKPRRNKSGNTSVDSMMEDTPANYNLQNQRFDADQDMAGMDGMDGMEDMEGMDGMDGQHDHDGQMDDDEDMDDDYGSQGDQMGATAGAGEAG